MTRKTFPKTQGTPPPRPRRSDRTRAAILDAAQRLFAAHGFERTTIRDVAAEAAIDPSMVMRYFGSKDELFVASAVLDLTLPDLGAVKAADVGAILTRHFLGMWEGHDGKSASAVLLRSAASNEYAAQRVRDIFAAQIVPMVSRVGGRKDVELRAGLVMTQLLGLALCRYILKIPPVAGLSVEEVVHSVAPAIQRYATGRSP
jgi:AcrR family transcriptional regulator